GCLRGGAGLIGDEMPTTCYRGQGVPALSRFDRRELAGPRRRPTDFVPPRSSLYNSRLAESQPRDPAVWQSPFTHEVFPCPHFRAMPSSVNPAVRPPSSINRSWAWSRAWAPV